MRRIVALGESVAFRANVERIEAAEAQRVFCRHGLSHLLDVARIAWILNLERACGLDRDVVYAAALLHDIGRAEQYATGENHDVAGVRVAAAILDALPRGLCFDAGEREQILDAVGGHRGACSAGAFGADCDRASSADCDSAPAAPRSDVLAALIKEADNRSRACFACPARDACYWPDERKNLSLDI